MSSTNTLKNAKPNELTLCLIVGLALDKTIYELKKNPDYVMDDETYNSMFHAVYTVMGDSRANKYANKKTYLA